jgi:hypothetical protein
MNLDPAVRLLLRRDKALRLGPNAWSWFNFIA